MEYLILGLLMLKKLTIYEMRSAVKNNFKSMCSDSMGSIQAAIKKLLEKDMVTFDERVEKSVNKKYYSITPAGRTHFLSWVNSPADLSKTKNMELAKLLFMGLVPVHKRVALIDEIIRSLEEELAQLHTIKEYQTHSDEKQSGSEFWQSDREYRDGIATATGIDSVEDNIEQIHTFEMLTLQLGIDSTAFYIQWFRQLRNKLTP